MKVGPKIKQDSHAVEKRPWYREHGQGPVKGKGTWKRVGLDQGEQEVTPGDEGGDGAGTRPCRVS